MTLSDDGVAAPEYMINCPIPYEKFATHPDDVYKEGETGNQSPRDI